jgi:putative membrane protein
MLQLLLAGLHLLALAIGLAAVLARARALALVARRDLGGETLRRAFAADAAWGIAAALWIATGLWRWLAGLERAAGYYNANPVFHAKMGLLAIVLLLEAWPMVTLVRWRAALRRGTEEAVALPGAARRMATISYAQAGLVVAMVFLAAAMARGFGARAGG